MLMKNKQRSFLKTIAETESIPSPFGIFLNPCKFFHAEFVRLQQNVIGNSDLSDVVQRCGDNGCLRFFIGQAKLCRNRTNVICNPCAVAGRVLISETYQRHQFPRESKRLLRALLRLRLNKIDSGCGNRLERVQLFPPELPPGSNLGGNRISGYCCPKRINLLSIHSPFFAEQCPVM